MINRANGGIKMGFFDKLKKTFSGNKKEETNNSVPLEEEKKEQLDQAADSEVKATADESDGQIDLETKKQLLEEEQQDTNQQEVALEEQVKVEPNKTEEVVDSKTVTHEEDVVNALEDEEVQEASVEKKYDKGLAKTRKTFSERMNELFANFRSVDEDFFEELEETLIGADVGFETSIRISEELKQEVKLKNAKKKTAVQNAIIEKLVNIYESEGIEENNALNLQKNALTIILFVGVNGVGKTTSIGKLAYQYKNEGKKVLLAAADTFRAGAIDQLVVWGERAGVEVVHGNAGGDPASVVFDAVKKAKEQQADILLVDTAGRLQNKVHLMKELEKIKRIIQREVPEAPHEVLLVLDATTGQNAMVQAKQFKETTDVTGLVLTKLDGTAKGGIVLAIRNELHLPVKLVGLGEGIGDLQAFDPTEFVYGLFKELITVED